MNKMLGNEQVVIRISVEAFVSAEVNAVFKYLVSTRFLISRSRPEFVQEREARFRECN